MRSLSLFDAGRLWPALAFLAVPCFGTTIGFRTLGTVSGPSLTLGDVTVTGSADVSASPLFGLGVVGGINPGFAGAEFMSEGESVTFTFNSLASGVFFSLAECGGATQATCGQSTLTAFGSGGTLLGSLNIFPNTFPGGLGLDVSNLFSNQLLSSFRVTVINDGPPDQTILNIDTVTYTSTVPEPSTLGMMLIGGIAAAIRALRRRHAPERSA